MIKLAEKNAASYGVDAKYVQGNAINMPYEAPALTPLFPTARCMSGKTRSVFLMRYTECFTKAGATALPTCAGM